MRGFDQVGGQGPTAIVVVTPAVLADVSGGGTALVELIAAVAMGFVAYAFIITRGFNSAGSVYGFTGAVGGLLSWQVYAVIAFALVTVLAYLDITIWAAVILALEGVSMLLVTIACGIVLAKDGFQGQAYDWDALAAAITLPIGIALSFAYPPLRYGIGNSPLLEARASALLGCRSPGDR